MYTFSYSNSIITSLSFTINICDHFQFFYSTAHTTIYKTIKQYFDSKNNILFIF